MGGRIILEYNPHRPQLKLELWLEAVVGINKLRKKPLSESSFGFSGHVVYSLNPISSGCPVKFQSKVYIKPVSIKMDG